MPEIQGPPAELRITLQIHRAATGQTETVQLVGHVVPPPGPADQPAAAVAAQPANPQE